MYNKRLVKEFKDGTDIVFATGNFDDYCVFIKDVRNKDSYTAPLDKQYFSLIKQLSFKYGNDKLYKDYCKIYELTTDTLNADVLTLIDDISEAYDEELRVNKLFTILYLGMIAEENKKRAVLKKRIKRLGIYQTLYEDYPPNIAANFSRGKNCFELMSLCSKRGF